eukprot:11778610-Alexandrium_andersonii.AAC.1
MSASLVGSEMCIRDRTWTQQFSNVNLERRLRLGHPIGVRFRVSFACSWRCCLCLLYTSPSPRD